jgi:ATP phosphoribosyltransferase regulatory subunit
MKERRIHTPEGVRDIYNGECTRKNLMAERMKNVLKSYGYRDIQTPTFEFFDIFNVANYEYAWCSKK